MVELLAPAGSYDSLRAAVNAGADAVYIGGSMFGARAYADNPEEELLIQGIEYCHLHGRKLYMTVNTLLKEQELKGKLYDFLLPYYEHGVDGLIVQDLGVVKFVREHFPGLDVHASTQMTVTSAESARLLKQEGITRVVPARELSLPEVKTIIEETGVEVETFIHGAMCYCYSGQCLLSSMIGGRSGNRGRCAQPCRLPYQLEESQKKLPPYLLSMKDMCTLELLPEILESGIASLKIEGRMKRPEYTAGVVSIYRKYIDLYQEKGAAEYRVKEADKQILMDLYNRGGFSEGYYHTQNGRSMMAMERPNHFGTQAAKVVSAGKGKVRAKALLELGKNDVLEFQTGVETTLGSPVKKNTEFTISCAGKLPSNGSMINRTKNDTLLRELNQKYVLENIKEKIKGDLRISAESPAILKLTWQEISVTVTGMCAEKALTNPATKESVIRQMKKTGNTPFVFEELFVELNGDLFVQVKDLNALRRQGLEALEKQILAKYQRRIPEDSVDQITSERKTECSAAFDTDQKIQMNVLVTTVKQLESVLSCQDVHLDTVYLDSLLFSKGQEVCSEAYGKTLIMQVREKGYRCFLNCPPVFREMDRRFLENSVMQKLLGEMDGFLLHTMDQFAYFRTWISETGSKAELAADHSLYAYNTEAAAYWKQLGAGRMILPVELNVRELMQLNRSDTELEIYGYQPLMQSAQCVRKNTKGCSKVPEILHIIDRKKTIFPVLNRCYVCCNTVFNSVPLQLLGSVKEIRQLAPSYVRLSFTVEEQEETRNVLKQYARAFQESGNDHAQADGTRGHFKRGVE